MMKQPRTRTTMGCLYIGELTSGAETASGLSLFMGSQGADMLSFTRSDGEALREQLQAALHRARSGGACSIISVGTGCCGALALSEQLPVERMVLMNPVLHPRAGEDRQLFRLAAFARRNLSLCTANILVAGRLSAQDARALSPASLSVYSSFARVLKRGSGDEELYTMREEQMKPVISHFLNTGELPKSLAENSEMCIIYG